MNRREDLALAKTEDPEVERNEEATDQGSSFFGRVACLGVGTLLGAGIGLALGAKKEVHQFAGAGWPLTMAGGALLAVFLIHVFAGGVGSVAWNRAAQGINRFRRLTRAVLLTGTSGLIVCGAIIGAEWAFGPKEGIANRVVAWGGERYDAWAAKGWGQADFVIVNPSHRAVAIKYVGATAAAPEFKILAKADGAAADNAMKGAWDSGVPLVANLPSVAHQLYDAYDSGRALLATDATSLAEQTRFRPLVPTGAELISFVQHRDGKERLRVGHVLYDADSELHFCDLVPRTKKAAAGNGEARLPRLLFETEFIPRSDLIVVSSLQRKLSDSSLRDTGDFLEYCIYSMLARIQEESSASDKWSLRPCICVDDVFVEHNLNDTVLAALKQEQKSLRSEQAQIVQMTSAWERMGLGAIAGSDLNPLIAMMQSMGEQRQDIKDDVRALKGLLDNSRRIRSEILRRLSSTSLTFVDRSKGFAAACRKANGRDFQRPEASEVVQDLEFLQATHVLLTVLSKPGDSDCYQLEMRLVDTRTSRIIWADGGDWSRARSAIMQAVPREPATTSNASAVSPGKSGEPATIAAKPVDIRGDWRSAYNGVSIRIEESNSNVEAKLVSHPYLEEFKVLGTRSERGVNVNSSFLVFKHKQFGGTQYPMKGVQLNVLDNRHVEIVYPQLLSATPAGVQLSQSTSSIVFERQK